MVNLHKLIDAINKSSPESNDLFGLAALQLRDSKNEILCFDAGKTDNLNGAPTPTSTHMPFKKIWVEFKQADTALNPTVCIHAEEFEFGVLCSIWSINNKKEWIYGDSFSFDKSEDGGFSLRNINTRFSSSNIKREGGDKKPFHHVLKTAHLFYTFLGALSRKGSTTTEHKLSNALNKSRSRKGKQPLFKFYTLNIDMYKNKEKKSHKGGSHASPRPHKRRGHYATSKKGKTFWRKDSFPNKNKQGMIHKDYAAKYTKHQGATESPNPQTTRPCFPCDSVAKTFHFTLSTQHL